MGVYILVHKLYIYNIKPNIFLLSLLALGFHWCGECQHISQGNTSRTQCHSCKEHGNFIHIGWTLQQNAFLYTKSPYMHRSFIHKQILIPRPTYKIASWFKTQLQDKLELCFICSGKKCHPFRRYKIKYDILETIQL